MKTKTKRSEILKSMREHSASGKTPVRKMTEGQTRSFLRKIAVRARLRKRWAKAKPVSPTTVAGRKEEPKAPTIKVLITMPVKLAKQLRERADSIEISQSELVCRFLRRRKQPGVGVKIPVPTPLPVIVKDAKTGRLKSVAREREFLA